MPLENKSSFSLLSEFHRLTTLFGSTYRQLAEALCCGGCDCQALAVFGFGTVGLHLQNGTSPMLGNNCQGRTVGTSLLQPWPRFQVWSRVPRTLGRLRRVSACELARGTATQSGEILPRTDGERIQLRGSPLTNDTGNL